MSDDQKPAEGADEIQPIVMKMKKKYLVKKPGNKGVNKKHNSGGAGRRAKAQKRAVYVTGRVCPEQYGLWKSWMEKNGIPILG